MFSKCSPNVAVSILPNDGGYHADNTLRIAMIPDMVNRLSVEKGARLDCLG